MQKSYAKKYADPRWRAKRAEILERDRQCCQACGDSDCTLHVHHRYYRWGNDPWDYPDDALITLCEDCHDAETEIRSDARTALIEAVTPHLSAAEVLDLAAALKSMLEMGHADVLASALSAKLRQPGWIHEMYDEYFRDLLAKRGK